MLKTRVVTALALMALLLPGLFLLSQWAWVVLVSACVGLAAWEWGRLIGVASQGRIVLGAVTALVAIAFAFIRPDTLGIGASFSPKETWVVILYAVTAAFWCVLIPVWLKCRWSLQGLAGLMVGAIVLLPTWLAMVQLRMLGASVLLGIFSLVWVADIAAYFAGKALGKHKLAPQISPGKTWEGAVGACIGVVAYGVVLRLVSNLEHFSWLMWVAALIGLTAISIVGDLFESLLKRRAGIKDSSTILPGHGGVLDRIDSLTSTLPVVALLWLLFVHR